MFKRFSSIYMSDCVKIGSCPIMNPVNTRSVGATTLRASDTAEKCQTDDFGYILIGAHAKVIFMYIFN